MNSYARAVLASLVWTALFTTAVAPAYAQEPIEATEPPPLVVDFINITDAAPGVCYDPARTQADPTDQTQLIIGVHSGLNPANWSNTACIASTAAFHARQMSDAIAVRVQVSEGYYISGLTFAQDGVASAQRLGQVFASAQWVVDGYPAIASITGARVTGLCKASVDVSFSIFLAAKAPPSLGSASASVSNPRLVATVEKLPPTGCP